MFLRRCLGVVLFHPLIAQARQPLKIGFDVVLTALMIFKIAGNKPATVFVLNSTRSPPSSTKLFILDFAQLQTIMHSAIDLQNKMNVKTWGTGVVSPMTVDLLPWVLIAQPGRPP
ncbi:hypothetical protein FNV43_RR10249 [Rhamnella rubrinervis]|uniref:Uncharacterized protein n=1 Tax=Rhamnella rubrinervis TaxID=2594499 RepID=A0A8K0HCT4_9ROSA|nr:hypothetical protein FNV43_RR10249 [Rhamnella rubrinervis]